MTEMRLMAAEVIEATGGLLLSGDMGVVFSGVGTDSRTIGPGEIFVALKGPRFDGHDFVASAIKAGASGALVEDWPPGLNLFELHKAITIIKVRDTLKALGDLASWWRKKLGLMVLAITGSCGKTTTKDIAAAIFASQWPTLKTEGNFNNLIGLPLTLLKAREGVKWAVLEMGANRPGEIARLSEIASPDIGLVTNVAPAHLEGFGSLEGVYKAKGELYEALSGKTAVVCQDDKILHRLALSRAKEVVTYSLSDPTATVTAEDIVQDEKGLAFVLSLRGKRLKVRLPLWGRHNVVNALAASSCALAAGIPAEIIARGLAEVEGRTGRFYPVALGSGAVLIDDTYNANPASVAAGLSAARELANGRPLVVVFADMLELGEASSELHCQIAEEIYRVKPSLLLTYGEFASHTSQRAQELGLRTEHLNTKEKLFLALGEALKRWPKAVILVKGSRSMGLDELCSRLREGG